jgi:hypothetical protein
MLRNQGHCKLNLLPKPVGLMHSNIVKFGRMMSANIHRARIADEVVYCGSTTRASLVGDGAFVERGVESLGNSRMPASGNHRGTADGRILGRKRKFTRGVDARSSRTGSAEQNSHYLR